MYNNYCAVVAVLIFDWRWRWGSDCVCVSGARVWSGYGREWGRQGKCEQKAHELEKLKKALSTRTHTHNRLYGFNTFPPMLWLAECALAEH